MLQGRMIDELIETVQWAEAQTYGRMQDEQEQHAPAPMLVYEAPLPAMQGVA